MADLSEIMARMISENRQSRERFERLATRTVSAIATGNSDEFSRIIRDANDTPGIVEPAADPPTGSESSVEPVETGDANGIVGHSNNAAPSATE